MRAGNRSHDQIRTLKTTFDIFPNAQGSVLFECGNTKILCAVTVQPGVPPFMRGSGSGWLNAEYALLPAATKPRNAREITQMRRNKRSTEISRLIGRSLRTVCDLSALGERTIIVDCDVLQADGGTRVASICAASIALQRAQHALFVNKELSRPFLTSTIAAVSVGIQDGIVLLDPDYQEDCSMEADFNVVMTTSGNLIEMQGGAEKEPVSWDVFDEVRAVAHKGIEQLNTFFNATTDAAIAKSNESRADKKPLFSLKSRLEQLKK